MVADKGALPNKPTVVVLAVAAKIECHLVHPVTEEEWAGVLCSLAAKERDTYMEPLLEAKAPPTVIFFARAFALSQEGAIFVSTQAGQQAPLSPQYQHQRPPFCGQPAAERLHGARHWQRALLAHLPPHARGVVLLLGDTQPPFPLPLNYTPLIEISLPLPYFDRVAYSVQLEGICVVGTLLPIPKSVLIPDHTGAGQTMADSGS
ncbi:hypothetical protein Cni_G28613 [Canna indica]|uniref:Uncharacterized protein n=1 Tax=Canna indica TaxID=4628 RepID=A0AAQ3L7N7_9LILI|nr:hypothetical protein Cni_G28613 [Canna indica]